jgi:flagellar biosynthesis/type III secretory pathway protein FliH
MLDDARAACAAALEQQRNAPPRPPDHHALMRRARAAAKTALRAATLRFHQREELAGQVLDLRAELIEAQRAVHLKMAEGYGQGYRDGYRDGFANGQGA